MSPSQVPPHLAPVISRRVECSGRNPKGRILHVDGGRPRGSWGNAIQRGIEHPDLAEAGYRVGAASEKAEVGGHSVVRHRAARGGSEGP